MSVPFCITSHWYLDNKLFTYLSVYVWVWFIIFITFFIGFIFY